MKLFLLLSAGALISLSASANEMRQSVTPRQSQHSVSVLSTRPAVKSRSVDSGAIIETPAGKLTDNMTMSEFALYPHGFDIYMRMVSGKVSAIVEGEDGCLYVKNPVGVYTTGSWLKLEHTEGTTYVANLPQPATESWDYEGEEVWMNYDRLAYDEDEGYYYPSFEESQLTFNYENGVLTSVGEIGEDEDVPVMLGLTYNIYGPEDADEAWAWFGVNNLTVQPIETEPLDLPAGLSAQKKVMSSSDGETHAWLAVDGNNIYLCTDPGLGYAVGTIDGGNAVFVSGQYLGVSGNSHCFFYGGESEFIEDEDYYEGYTTYHRADDITFDYFTEGSITLQSEGAIIINEGTLSFYAKQIFDKPVISDYDAVEAAPANPVIVRFEPYDDFDEYGVFVFDLPANTADGQTLSKVDLYYNIFFDGSDEPYVFTPGLYQLLDSPITNIPYNFTDGGYDFTVKGQRHTIVFYEDVPAIGVQSVNNANDNIYKSQIVWSNGDLSGIESVTANTDADITLYDITGRQVTEPTPGIYIRRNGKTADKVIIR